MVERVDGLLYRHLCLCTLGALLGVPTYASLGLSVRSLLSANLQDFSPLLIGHRTANLQDFSLLLMCPWTSNWMLYCAPT